MTKTHLTYILIASFLIFAAIVAIGLIGMTSEAQAAPLSTLHEVYTTNEALKSIAEDWGRELNGADLNGLYVGPIATAYYTENATIFTYKHEPFHHLMYHWKYRPILFLYWKNEEEAAQEYARWKINGYTKVGPLEKRKIQFFTRAEVQK